MADGVPSEPIATLVQLCNGLKASQALYVPRSLELRTTSSPARCPVASSLRLRVLMRPRCVA